MSTNNQIFDMAVLVLIYSLLAVSCYFLGPSLNGLIDDNLAFILVFVIPILIIISFLFMIRLGNISSLLFILLGLMFLIVFLGVLIKISFWLYLLLLSKGQLLINISLIIFVLITFFISRTYFNSPREDYFKLAGILFILSIFILGYNLANLSIDLWASAKASAVVFVLISISFMTSVFTDFFYGGRFADEFVIMVGVVSTPFLEVIGGIFGVIVYFMP